MQTALYRKRRTSAAMPATTVPQPVLRSHPAPTRSVNRATPLLLLQHHTEPAPAARSRLASEPACGTSDLLRTRARRLSDHGHEYRSAMPASAVLPNVNALPCPECQPATHHGNGLGASSQSASHVGGHVVGAFRVVFPPLPMRHQLVHESREVPQDCRVCVLLDHQAGRSMLEERSTGTRVHATARDDSAQLGGHVVEAPSRGPNLDTVLVGGHWPRPMHAFCRGCQRPVI